MSNSYPKGSEWRKWDLHIHTPKSIIQEYGGDNQAAWDAFMEKLANLPPEIKVIGITDYLFCDGYRTVLGRRNEIPNIELIIPNIEFRLSTFAGTAKNSQRHNFHVLFDPDVDIEDIQEQLLNCLSNGYEITNNTVWQQMPTVRSLEQLGRQIKAAAPTDNSVQDKTDIRVGFENITYKREDILKQLEKDCFRGKYVTAIGYSEWDQSRWDQSAAEKRNLINTANFCLTCQAGPQKIAENRADLIANKLNSLIMHSSDAHKLGDIDKTMLWIKADPTFAGLKQVLNEPDSRVFIGDAPPNYKPDHKIIKNISIPSSKGWFADDFSMDLNQDLITIVGGRGSGKSALAEAIAYGAGSQDSSDDAFLKKAAQHRNPITGTRIIVEWGDGQQTDFEVGNLGQDQGFVRYLPQGVVEELCSPKNSERLQEQIENVIFQALEEAERMGASDFNELKNNILGNFEFEKEQVVEKLQELNRELANISTVIRSVPEKEKTLEKKKQELDKLITSLPKLPPEDQKGQEELSKLTQVKQQFEAKAIEIRNKLNKISDIETKFKVFKVKVNEFNTEMRDLLSDIGVSESDPFMVKVNEDDTKRILEKRKAELLADLKTIREGKKPDVAIIMSMSEDDLTFENWQELNKLIDDKQKETRAFETIKIKYQEQKKLILAVESSIKSLEAEIARINDELEPKKNRLEGERVNIYFSYFELLENEKNEMEKLYKPLQDSLFAGTDTDRKLVFEAKIKYDLESHTRNGLAIIDRTRKGTFRESSNLKNVLNCFWEDISRNELEKAAIISNIDGIIKLFTTHEGCEILVEDQLRENYALEDFYNWLFDPNYFKIVSSLKFDGTDLYLLSPGQKGIILLILYLEIDKADYRPLIIDQPEENLDNLSVYKDLIGFFRERKKYRQIIMVTHNPNLVVNTDAEQIIVAQYEGKRIPRLEYCSGSLEDEAKKIPDVDVENLEDGIIEQVCNILEGGERAFESRKRKYQISRKSRI